MIIIDGINYKLQLRSSDNGVDVCVFNNHQRVSNSNIIGIHHRKYEDVNINVLYLWLGINHDIDIDVHENGSVKITGMDEVY